MGHCCPLLVLHVRVVTTSNDARCTELMLLASDTAGPCMLGTPHNRGKEHPSFLLSDSDAVACIGMERMQLFGQAMQLVCVGAGSSAIIKAGNVAS